MAAAGIPAAAINTVQDALDNPITQSRGLVIDLEGVPMIASPLRLSQTPVRYTLPPPALGQHSDEIVRAAGLDPDALRAAGAIIG
jgi:crotonobetainyl-CoA:carnitine CoA-transferase CaiB-like acyl-CoA transferase